MQGAGHAWQWWQLMRWYDRDATQSSYFEEPLSKAKFGVRQVKETVQEKFMSEEALEEKRKVEARKKRWGPFGIFPKGN